MKYTKLIITFLFINLLLVFAMIFIANNTREIEKNNNKLKIKISKISQNLKINTIELATYQNTSYLRELYTLYFFQTNNNFVPQIVKIDQLLKEDESLKLVKSEY
tara:strand:- start:2209 stop:2523 length:315 start_codon:yes stop_codon:yes gene_type:complete